MKFRVSCFVALAILGFACDDSDENGSRQRSITVASFNSVDVDGNTVVRFDPGLNSNETVVIKGSPQHVGNVDVEVVNGTLVIRSSDNVQLSDSLTIIANPSSLTNITLEADQKAVVYWDGDHDNCFDNISIKTEANSMFGLFNVCANNITLQQEAQSKVQLESWFSQDIDTLAIADSDVVVVGEGLYLIEGDYLIAADSIREVEVNNENFVVFVGPTIRRYRIAENLTAVLQATSQLDADEMAMRHVDIKLEGESEASIWAIETVTGRGEGKSSLIYRGSPTVSYTTQGEATIEKD